MRHLHQLLLLLLVLVLGVQSLRTQESLKRDMQKLYNEEKPLWLDFVSSVQR